MDDTDKAVDGAVVDAAIESSKPEVEEGPAAASSGDDSDDHLWLCVNSQEKILANQGP